LRPFAALAFASAPLKAPSRERFCFVDLSASYKALSSLKNLLSATKMAQSMSGDDDAENRGRAILDDGQRGSPKVTG
jgi:hypothetical protein